MSREVKPQDWQEWLPWSKDLSLPPAALASAKSPPIPSHDPPEIAVIIPVGPDHGELVIDALDSVDAQNMRDWECIVVNDSGKPLRWTPSWAKVIETSGEIGVAAARNLGIAASRAPLFLPLDADDTLEPLALATLYTMQQDLGGYVYPDFHERWQGKEMKTWDTTEWDPFKLLTEGCLHAVTAIYRKSDWEKVGGFDESLPAWEDWDFQIALASIGVCGTRAPWPLFTYRKDTGVRREKNYAEYEASREGIYNKWREYYERRKELMACGSCPGGGGRGRGSGSLAQMTQISRPQAQASENREDYVEIEFIGIQQGSRSFRPSPGRSYTFSSLPSGRVKWIHKEDLAFFEQRPEFKIPEAVSA